MDRLALDRDGLLGRPAPVVTVGNFDGVHRGHRALVAEAVEGARAARCEAVVLTFDPHPARVLRPSAAPPALTTLAQREELLVALGVSRLAVLPFGSEVAALSPEEFAVRILAGVLRAREVVVGESFRFGRGRSGDVDVLRSLGARIGFGVRAVPPVLEDGAAISSSRIREALRRGDVKSASALLGREPFVDAQVVRGEGRGRRIGIPTANLVSENEVIPSRGVYVARCRLEAGEDWPAVVNIGRRPTFGGTHETVEAHLLDFDGELYGARVRLAFVERLRGEERFAGAEALVARIREDIARARTLLSEGGAKHV
jgi:riboflavin kinase/FMN adenylyltransferase